MNHKPEAEDAIPPALPAATLVLFRDRPDGPSDLLVVERSAKMAFAGGAIVFPGGRIDADDHAIAGKPSLVRGAEGLEIDEAAARVGAIRETLEETGLVFGFAETPDAGWIAATRQALHAREPFGALLESAGLSLDLAPLVPFARWCPKHREARVFDTRFYIGQVAADAPDPVVDETENVSSFWASAATLIEADDTDKVHVIYPTRRNLERLALFGTYAEAHAHALSIPVEMISPFTEERDGALHLCIPDHLGYPVTSQALAGAKTAYKRPG